MKSSQSTVIRNATMDDYDIVFTFIEKLWTYNTYDKNAIREVYQEVLESADTFAFLLFDGDAEMVFYHVLSNPKNVQDFYTNNQLIQLPKELMASFVDETTSD